ncbi:hypothetical protein SEA_PATIO_15 [Gordonia phage Patio]|uniref:Uncharacterized protein n=1 Tax=Gordonia phage Patio TaxID=2041515 RepID=A0A2D2W4H4_9CAUD|nr:hypothetical protein KNT76_gp15 [Gordonia phage Patio]ATS93097.1 hypothetical protein SEA_PATIO_15 [Gordonia phage Patio]
MSIYRDRTTPVEIRILGFYLVIYQMAKQGPGRNLRAGTVRRNIVGGKTVGIAIVLRARSWTMSIGKMQ